MRILTGDCRDVLKTLPDESVHCVVTSPPYWGLRDYGNGDSGIGLEPSVEEHLVAIGNVFAEVRRVLRSDGTLWLNLGDSYAGSGRGGNPTEATSTLQGGQASQRASMVKRTRGASEVGASARDAAVTNVGRRATRGSQLPAGFHETARQDGAIGRAWVPPPAGFKQKDLMGMPWRVAFALQAAGWWLRSDIIWSKPNPMPESIRDRPTKSHEYVFLLSKSERYFYDMDAIREPIKEASVERGKSGFREGEHDKHNNYGDGFRHSDGKPVTFNPLGRNVRTVWEIATSPFTEAHFATFPPELAERCIKAGCPAGGVVLDPFGGAGTVGLVADRLQRDAILIELNPDYAAMAERRIKGDAPMFAQVNP